MAHIDELVRRVTMNERRLDDLVFPETVPDMISCFTALLGLRGFWPAAPINEFSELSCCSW